jgi:hypothetical protein
MISLLLKEGAVRADIRRCGYAFVSGSKLSLSSDTNESWEELRGDWDRLPADAYLRDQGGYRFRRYDRFSFLPLSGELLPLPHTAFLQRKEFNKLYGDIEREFAGLAARTLENAFLRELIEFDFRQFFPRNAPAENCWEVGIHEIRIVAKRGEAARPTPEGAHRDGCNFIAMHLVRRRSIVGGVTTLYDENENVLRALTLLDPLDSVYVEDARVMHNVTPVYAESHAPGVRDMLVVTYDCSLSVGRRLPPSLGIAED